ncbi:hypothetical protein AB0E81_11220 [Streptomyces sp. NPDC033538]|uniref:hypothetical protein n=1 Tax=Streptomyces sp. NPDC033538 TaxID=3155367 RepID=UPI0033E63254
MAKIIASSGVTVELSGREVALIVQALRHAVDSYGGWDSYDDSEAADIEHALSRGVE